MLVREFPTLQGVMGKHYAAHAGEPRVAASPDTVKRIKGLGLEVIVEAGAGRASRITDEGLRISEICLADGETSKVAG